MNTMTKNLLIVTSLAILSANAFSQDRRSRDEDRRNRYRDRYREMDICIDIKQNVERAEHAYNNFAVEIDAADRRVSDQNAMLSSRRSNLERKKSAYEQAKIQVAELENLKEQKPRLLIENNAKLADANASIPGLRVIKDTAQSEKDRKCKGLVRVGSRARECKEAKDKLETAERNLNAMTSQKTQAESVLARLARVESDLTRVKSILVSSLETLTTEQNLTPTIAELSTNLRILVDQRSAMNAQFSVLEEELGRLEVRLDKCVDMRYTANRGTAFKRALLIFAEGNGAGCDKAVAMLRSTQEPSARDGIKEAHDLYCVSETLVRVVEVPAQAPTH